jgi:hypothetical protein
LKRENPFSETPDHSSIASAVCFAEKLRGILADKSSPPDQVRYWLGSLPFLFHTEHIAVWVRNQKKREFSGIAMVLT